MGGIRVVELYQVNGELSCLELTTLYSATVRYGIAVVYSIIIRSMLIKRDRMSYAAGLAGSLTNDTSSL